VRLQGLLFALGVLLSWCLPGIASAADLRAEVAIDRETMGIGETLALTLAVTREGRGPLPEPELPNSVTENFDVSGCGSRQSSQTHLVGNSIRMVHTRATECSLLARREGTFKIAFSVSDGHQTFNSNLVEVAVSAAPAVPTASAPGERPSEAYGWAFLWATADRERAYVGQPVHYQLDFYYTQDRRRRFGAALRAAPSFQEFMFSHELPAVEPRIEEVDGVAYSVETISRRGLIAASAGTYVVSPAEIEVRGKGVVRSAPVTIEVLPLPAEGQPPGFAANNVGRYTIDASIDRTTLKVGQPATLTIQIAGTGNIDLVDPKPWPELDGLRRYDPKTETKRDTGERLGGVRRYEFLVIPERPGALTIPTHELHFFDPEVPGYETVRTVAIPLEVEGTPLVDQNPETPGTASAKTEDQSDTASDGDLPLIPIIAAEALPRTAVVEPWLTFARWSYGMLAVPLLAGLSLGGGFLWRRFGPDEAARLRSRNRARRRSLIDKARSAVRDGEGFHTAVATLLQELAVERAGPEGVGLPRLQLAALLGRRGLQSTEIAQWERLLDRCDRARFGSQAPPVHGGSSDPSAPGGRSNDSQSEREAFLEDALKWVRSTSAWPGAMR